MITTGSLDHAVLVPQTAVTGLKGGRGTVWTVEDGTLARRDVAVGAPLLSGHLPIVDRLPESVQVVVSPVTGLRVGRAAVIAPTASRNEPGAARCAPQRAALRADGARSWHAVRCRRLDDRHLRGRPRRCAPPATCFQSRSVGGAAAHAWAVRRTVAHPARYARPGAPHPWGGRGRCGDVPDGADRGERQAAAHVRPGL